MRLTGGLDRGRRLIAPRGARTRPTASRVREALFNILGPPAGPVLDLYAGTGALGLEALSRGAASATFVESDRDACRTIGANLDTLGLNATVLCQDVVRMVSGDRRRYGLILCDPPYDYDRTKLVPHLARLLADDGVLVYESSGREDAPQVPGLEERTSRKYGSARLTLFEL
jgi:16S rRNA (guanine966-N2)-methyltransferase